MLESVIATSVIIPPKMKQYPEIEAVLWQTLQKAIIGKMEEEEALNSIVRQIADIVNRASTQSQHSTVQAQKESSNVD